jgi:hypothetical protein
VVQIKKKNSIAQKKQDKLKRRLKMKVKDGKKRKYLRLPKRMLNVSRKLSLLVKSKLSPSERIISF